MELPVGTCPIVCPAILSTMESIVAVTEPIVNSGVVSEVYSSLLACPVSDASLRSGPSG